MREIVHLQAGQCGNQIGAKVGLYHFSCLQFSRHIDLVKINHKKIQNFNQKRSNFNANLLAICFLIADTFFLSVLRSIMKHQ